MLEELHTARDKRIGAFANARDFGLVKDKVLLKGGTVLSCDRAVGNVVAGDVLIEDGLIVEVGAGLRSRGAEVIDASETIVMPGFVDAHRYVWQSLTRNLGSTASPTIGDHYTPDDVYAATLAGLLGAIEAGITTVVDWFDLSSTPEHVEAAISGHADSGIRSVLVTAPSERSAKAKAGERLTFASASPDIVEASLDDVVTSWAQIRATGRRIHARAGITSASGGAVAELGRRGVLGPDVTLSHCCNLTTEDFDAISSSSTCVALMPSSDMAAGVGAPPMQQLIDRNIRPGLGIGEERLAPGDAFAQMRASISVQHAVLFEAKLAGKGAVPNLLNTRDVLRYATIDGANAAGLSAVTGSLTPGKRADVLVLRADSPNIAPINDPIGAVVWGMDTSNIDWVLVGGSPVVQNGELTADVQRAIELANAAQGRLIDAADDLAGSGADRS